MCVLNQLDRFTLVGDVFKRVSQLSDRLVGMQKILHDQLLDHKKYIAIHGDDMPSIRDWRWSDAYPANEKADLEADNV
jgi:xylulose-5-phosphate/fructose-6-phosphate phosphoketolase